MTRRTSAAVRRPGAGRLELRLIECLDALLAERNVSRAAARMGMTQSSMSAALKQLRVLLGDPLFVRGAHGITPTPRALELGGQARDLLERAERLAGEAARFEPSRARRAFSVIANDYVQSVLFPGLVSALAREAPGVVLATRQADPIHLTELFARGELDLGVGWLPSPPGMLRAKKLLSERMVLVAGTSHPDFARRAASAASLRAAVSGASHVAVNPAGAGYYERIATDAFAAAGLERAVRLTTASFLVAAQVVAGSRMLAVLPERVARAAGPGLRILPAPLALPRIEVSMYWHNRSHQDPGCAWLRDAVTRAAGSL